MSKVLVDEANLTAIGNAIRSKNSSTDKYKPSEMAAAILALTPQLQTGTKFTFNKNNNMGPIGLVVDRTTYILNGGDASINPLFLINANNGFDIYSKYDSSVTPAITANLFDIDGALYNFFANHEIKLTIENSGVGLLWSSPNYIRDNGSYSDAYYNQQSTSVSAASITGDWTKTSTDSTDISTVWNNLVTTYNNGENLVVEFITNS